MFKIPECANFVVAENYIIDTSETAHVRISYLSDNFNLWFLTKVERDLAGSDIRLWQFGKKSLDQPIMDELGDKYEVSLYGFRLMLAQKQSSGDHSSMIGYAIDAYGVLRAVRALARRWLERRCPRCRQSASVARWPRVRLSLILEL